MKNRRRQIQPQIIPIPNPSKFCYEKNSGYSRPKLATTGMAADKKYTGSRPVEESKFTHARTVKVMKVQTKSSHNNNTAGVSDTSKTSYKSEPEIKNRTSDPGKYMRDKEQASNITVESNKEKYSHLSEEGEKSNESAAQRLKIQDASKMMHIDRVKNSRGNLLVENMLDKKNPAKNKAWIYPASEQPKEPSSDIPFYADEFDIRKDNTRNCKPTYFKKGYLYPREEIVENFNQAAKKEDENQKLRKALKDLCEQATKYCDTLNPITKLGIKDKALLSLVKQEEEKLVQCMKAIKNEHKIAGSAPMKAIIYPKTANELEVAKTERAVKHQEEYIGFNFELKTPEVKEDQLQKNPKVCEQILVHNSNEWSPVKKAHSGQRNGHKAIGNNAKIKVKEARARSAEKNAAVEERKEPIGQKGDKVEMRAEGVAEQKIGQLDCIIDLLRNELPDKKQAAYYEGILNSLKQSLINQSRVIMKLRKSESESKKIIEQKDEIITELRTLKEQEEKKVGNIHRKLYSVNWENKGLKGEVKQLSEKVKTHIASLNARYEALAHSVSSKTQQNLSKLNVMAGKPLELMGMMSRNAARHSANMNALKEQHRKLAAKSRKECKDLLKSIDMQCDIKLIEINASLNSKALALEKKTEAMKAQIEENLKSNRVTIDRLKHVNKEKDIKLESIKSSLMSVLGLSLTERDVEQIVEKLKETIKRYKGSIENLRSNVLEQKNRLKRSDDEKTLLEEGIKKLREENKNILQTNEKLVEERRELVAVLDKKEKCKELEKQNAQRSEKEYKSKIEKLKEENSAFAEDNAKLRSANARYKKAQKVLLSKDEDHEKKIAELERENSTIRQQINKLESELKLQVDREIKCKEENTRLVKDLNQQLEDKTKECKTLAKRLQECVAENAKLWKAANDKSKEENNRAEALEGSETDRVRSALIKSANATINEMMEREQKHLKEIENISRKYDALKRIKRQEDSAFAAENRRLREQLRKVTFSLVTDTPDTMQHEIPTKGFDYEQLMKEKEMLRREVEAAKDGYKECEKRMMELAEESKEAKSQCDSFRKKYKAKSSRVTELELEIESLNNYINELDNRNERLSKRKLSLEEKIKNMEKCNPEECPKEELESLVDISLQDSYILCDQ